MTYVNTGKNLVRNWLSGNSTSAYPTAMGIGTSSSSVSVDDTALSGENFRDSFDSTDTGSERIVKLNMVLGTTEATSSTVREMGVFNDTASTSGDMFLRNTFAEVSKTDSIEMEFESGIEVT